MKTNHASFTRMLGLIAILAGTGISAVAQTYTTFDADPHATFPHHIDSSGRIVGNTFSASQVYGGFVRNTDGSIVLVNVPAGISTDFVTFAASGQVAGGYTDSSYAQHGFSGPVGGPYTTFDVAGANSTSVSGANSAGQTVGIWRDSAGAWHDGNDGGPALLTITICRGVPCRADQSRFPFDVLSDSTEPVSRTSLDAGFL